MNTQQEHEQTDLTRMEDYGMYYLGALLAVKKVVEMMQGEAWKNLERPYREAELRLITQDKRSMQLFMDGTHTICYRGHQRNKKGKLTWVEAYFADKKTRWEEVK